MTTYGDLIVTHDEAQHIYRVFNELVIDVNPEREEAVKSVIIKLKQLLENMEDMRKFAEKINEPAMPLTAPVLDYSNSMLRCLCPKCTKKHFGNYTYEFATQQVLVSISEEEFNKRSEEKW